jgi:protein TonB
MGYQALLFCPDEKTARTVTQVLRELDFSVIPCTEPFAAVKKLMNERFDAVVVDCDNEQNATLLFKSARNVANNQSALAVAVVEGQAGVAKAFRIGANLVLTKPINVEQAKGTLRVARGLLRKNEGTKPTGPAATPVVKPAASAPAPAKPAPAVTIPSSPSPRPAAPIAPIVPVPSVFTQKPAQPPSMTASASIEIDEETLDSIEEACDPAASQSIVSQSGVLPSGVSQSVTSLPTSPTVQSSVPKVASVASSPAIADRKMSGGFAASAPAPAREPQPTTPAVEKPSAVISHLSTEAAKTDVSEKTLSSDAASVSAPTLTFGGTVADETKPASGGSKKALWAAVAAVVVAAAGYAAWTQRASFMSTPSTPVNVAAQPATAALGPAPQAAPVTASTSIATSSPETPTPVPQTSVSPANPPGRASKAITAESSKPSALAPPANKPVAANPAPEPIIIKSQHSQLVGKPVATPDAPALSVTEIAQDQAGTLPNLMGPSDAPTPVLQRVTVSQGVSRGLLVKQVQPVYPRGALQLHVEGSVQLMATVSKNGDISEVKVLSGDSQLSHAAVDAVKQWKYKPYLLNGEPMDIQTQITVNFKLPH